MEPLTPKPEPRIDRSVLAFGVALVVAGLVLTLVKLDLIHLEGLSRLWPLFVVGYGVSHMVGAEKPKKRRAGLWIAMVGVWLLVNSLQLFGLFWHNSWPLLMILLALLRIFWPGDNEDRAGGLLLLSVGTWMLLVVTHSFGLEWRTAWPLLLVLVGLSMVVRAVLQALPTLMGGRS